MAEFDYGAPAGLFTRSSLGVRARPPAYRRFGTAAEALRFAIEELPAPLQAAMVLETEDDRFEAAEIRRLYDSPAYPLKRASQS